MLRSGIQIKANEKWLAETGQDANWNYALVIDSLWNESFLRNNTVKSINHKTWEVTQTTPYFYTKSGNYAYARQGTWQYINNWVERNWTWTPSTLDQIEG